MPHINIYLKFKIMQTKFTIEEIRKFLEKEDALPSTYENLTAENIIAANIDDEGEE